MIAMREARALALGLPEAVEQDHHGIQSFRVRGKIFATVPDGGHLRIMADEADIRAAVAEDSAACAELWWGSRLACVVVDLRHIARALLEELLIEAWRGKAPKRLAHDYDHAAERELPSGRGSIQ